MPRARRRQWRRKRECRSWRATGRDGCTTPRARGVIGTEARRGVAHASREHLAAALFCTAAPSNHHAGYRRPRVALSAPSMLRPSSPPRMYAGVKPRLLDRIIMASDEYLARIFCGYKRSAVKIIL